MVFEVWKMFSTMEKMDNVPNLEAVINEGVHYRGFFLVQYCNIVFDFWKMFLTVEKMT